MGGRSRDFPICHNPTSPNRISPKNFRIGEMGGEPYSMQVLVVNIALYIAWRCHVTGDDCPQFQRYHVRMHDEYLHVSDVPRDVPVRCGICGP